MSWSRDEVLRKVRALLRLAEGNACEAEAAAAMAKVRRLLQEHDLSLSDVEVEHELADVGAVMSEELGRGFTWIWMLANTVAKITSTRNYRRQERSRRGRIVSSRMCFLGTPTESAAAAALFGYLLGAVRIMAAEAAAGLVSRNSFCLGVAFRLRARAQESLRREAAGGAGRTDIVLAKDQAIERWLRQMGEVTQLRTPRSPQIDEEAFAAGVRAGQSLSLTTPSRQLAVQGVLL